jgi:hypothetical protein
MASDQRQIAIRVRRPRQGQSIDPSRLGDEDE